MASRQVEELQGRVSTLKDEKASQLQRRTQLEAELQELSTKAPLSMTPQDAVARVRWLREQIGETTDLETVIQQQHDLLMEQVAGLLAEEKQRQVQARDRAIEDAAKQMRRAVKEAFESVQQVAEIVQERNTFAGTSAPAIDFPLKYFMTRTMVNAGAVDQATLEYVGEWGEA